MKRIFAGLLFGIIVVVAQAASMPEWLRESLAGVEEWQSKPAIRLLQSHTARFVTADRFVEVERSVVRVQSANGTYAAVFDYPYEPNIKRVLGIRGWLISPDGKKVTAVARSDFVDTPTLSGGLDWNNQRSISYDARSQVEIGGYFACELEMESSSPVTEARHDFMPSLPTERAVFEAIPPQGGKLLWHTSGRKGIMAPVEGPNAGSLRWMKNHLDELQTEELGALYPKSIPVMVRCDRPANSEMDISSWPNLSAAIMGVLAPQMDTGRAIMAKANELVGTKTDRWERIRALCEFAQRDIRYVAITLDKDYLAGYRPHAALDVLKKRYGDCKDKATLLLSLLGALGEKGHWLLVSAGDPFVIAEDWPTLGFNHVIVAIPADGQTPLGWPVVDGGTLGKLVVFDPTDPVTPLGALSLPDQGGLGLLVSSPGSGLVRLPFDDPEHTGTERHLEAVLSDQGELAIQLREDRFGALGSLSRSAHWLQQDERYGSFLEASWHAMFSGLRGFHWEDEWSPTSVRHRINYRFTIENYARRMGRERMLFSPRILESQYSWSAPRKTYDSVMLYTRREQETVRIRVPEGWEMDEMPQNWSAEQPHASCALTYRLEGNELVYQARVGCRGGFFEEKEYEELRQFMLKVQDAVRRPAVFVRKKDVMPAASPSAEASPLAKKTEIPRHPVVRIKLARDFEKVVLKENPAAADVVAYIADLKAAVDAQRGAATPDEIIVDQAAFKLSQIPLSQIELALKEAMTFTNRRTSCLPRAVIAMIDLRADELGDDLKEPVLTALSEYPQLVETIVKKGWWADAQRKAADIVEGARKANDAIAPAYVEVLVKLDTPEARAVLPRLLASGNGAALARNYRIAQDAKANWVDWPTITAQAWKRAERENLADIVSYAPCAAQHGVREALLLLARKLNGAPKPDDDADAALKDEYLGVLRQTLDIGSQDPKALVQYVFAHRGTLLFDRVSGKYKTPNR